MEGVLPVDCVIPGLYISGMRALYHADDLRARGISRVLKLYFGDPRLPPWPPDFEVCDNAIEDDAPVPFDCLRRGVDFIHQGMEVGAAVLVCCWAGISRSSAFVLAYLVELGYDLPEAWALLSSQHADAWPAFELWHSLLAYYDLPYTMEDVLTWLRWSGDEEAGGSGGMNADA